MMTSNIGTSLVNAIDAAESVLMYNKLWRKLIVIRETFYAAG